MIYRMTVTRNIDGQNVHGEQMIPEHRLAGVLQAEAMQPGQILRMVVEVATR